MNVNRGVILCLGYVFGLFLTSFLGGINSQPTVSQWGIVLGVITISTVIATIVIPRHFWQLRSPFVILTGCIALVAVIYFQFRIPKLTDDPIFQATQTEESLLQYPVTVVGKVISQPRQKTLQKKSFWLTTENIETNFEKFAVSGKIYISLDDDSTNFEIGDEVTLKGRLYQPKNRKNSWSFDFVKYLQKNNAFFSLNSWEVQNVQDSTTLTFNIRKRIVSVHQKFLGPEKGNLLSSMILGRKAVQLPEEIYDLWVKVGLAYTVAASGFHVALLLGSVQWLTRSQFEKTQFIAGTGVLVFYLLLTGLQASVLRAALMGFAGLIALLLDRKVKPLSLLILAATLLLLFNPLWIWDLGFQLSFFATFGLFVTLEPLQKKLDFLPPTIATAIAIPISASLWTLPLLAFNFNVIATFGIPTSILLSPLITFVSLIGMLSGAVGLLVPPLGSAIATIAAIPLGVMIWLVNWVVALPASNISVASLHWSQLGVIYGIMMAIWLTPWGKTNYKILGLGTFILFAFFLTFKQLSTTQLTVFSTAKNPLLVIQNKGKALVFDGGNNERSQFELTSFLQRSGIGKIEALVQVQLIEEEISEQFLPEVHEAKEELRFFDGELAERSQPLDVFSSQKFGDVTVRLMQDNPLLFEFRVNKQVFYVLGDRQAEDPSLIELPKGYLITNQKNIDFDLWETLRPQGAIAIGSKRDNFLAPNSIVYWTEEDGTIQWTPGRGLTSVAPE